MEIVELNKKLSKLAKEVANEYFINPTEKEILIVQCILNKGYKLAIEEGIKIIKR